MKMEKKQLTANIMFFIVAFIIFISSAFAWFNLSSKSDLKGINTNVDDLKNAMTEAINAERPALLTARIPKPNDTEMYPRQIGIPCDIPLRKFFFILTAPEVLSYLTYLSSVG